MVIPWELDLAPTVLPQNPPHPRLWYFRLTLSPLLQYSHSYEGITVVSIPVQTSNL